jgi:site-specific recombinase
MTLQHELGFDEPDVAGPPSDELPPREEFLRLIDAVDSKASPLVRVLLTRCNPEATLSEQLTALEQLGRFVVAGPSIAKHTDSALVRLELLINALERIPAARRRFQGTLHAVLSRTRAIKLFGEIGLPNDRGLLAETSDRLARRFLPQPPAEQELFMLVGRIVRSLDDLKWLGPAADPLLHRMAEAGGAAWEPLRASVLDAIGLITTRIAALGLAEAFRARTASETLRDSPLYHLTRAQPSQMPRLIAESREHLDRVKQALEERGVSVNVVYSIDSIEKGLERLEVLLPFLDPDDGNEATTEIRSLIVAVGRGVVGGRSFMQLLNDNMRLLARKVIERAGKTGEHYVTSSKREYFTMFGSAFGGGVLTLGTLVLKFFITWGPGSFSPLVDGLLSSGDYAASFIVMQLLGFTLATKQPSMTAASLAGTIRASGQLDELVGMIARIARSQFAAAMGNVSGVIATSLLFDILYTAATGHTFLPAADAHKTIGSFDPLGSGTIFFAAWTGVLLWMSSLAAGWFENWVVYRRLPEAIEHHRWGKRFGKARMKRWAHFIEHQAAGIGGSIALGFLLGMTKPMAKFIGIPLDVRHITLSTGSLTLSMSTLGIDGAGVGPFVWACVGIAIIGMLNFGVSFALALVVALRAREVPRRERRTLPGAVMRRFIRRPLEFVYPPKEPKIQSVR